MGNINKNTREFLRYITNPLTEYVIENTYKSNNIIFDRADMYLDFILSINHLIRETYLGDDVCDSAIQKEHFDWVWKRTCDKFAEEKIYFHENQGLYSYFRDFFNEVFYLLPEEDKINIHNLNSIERVWKSLFNYKVEKDEVNMKIFIDVYKLFDKSYKIK